MKKCKRDGCYSDAICKDGRCPEHTQAAGNVGSNASGIEFQQRTLDWRYSSSVGTFEDHYRKIMGRN